MHVKKYIPLCIILIALLYFYFSGDLALLTFETLQSQRNILLNFVDHHFIVSVTLYIFLYILLVAFSIPIGGFFTVLGGFLFPQPFCTLFVIIGATIGAILLFLAAKTAFEDFLKKRIRGFLKKVEKGFLRSPVSYLLFLRFVPLFPFWLVNLAPAFLGVRLWTFTWTTFIGIIPGSFIYTQAGTGLGAIFDKGESFSLNTIFNWQMRIALICLGIFSLIPIAIKKMRKKTN